MKIKKTVNDGPTGRERQEHPSFGMIGISNVTGKKALFGSAVEHQHFIILRIHEAEVLHDTHYDHHFATKLLCEVHLSHSQLSEMLFKANHGEGVPCTIGYVSGDKKDARPLIPYESPMKQSTDDLRHELAELLETSKTLARKAEKIAKGKMSKASDREELRQLAGRIAQDIESNLSFASTCIDEKLEKNISHAKAEIESFIDMKFRSVGIEHLKNDAPKLLE